MAARIMLLVETIFDTLNAKAALFAIEQFFDDHQMRLPVMISGTITDLPAAPSPARPPKRSGIRCARQTFDRPQLRAGPGSDAPLRGRKCRGRPTYLCQCPPNAGLPNAFGGYDDPGRHGTRYSRRMGRKRLVNIVGGCCGTTPEHIAAIAEAVSNRLRARCRKSSRPAACRGWSRSTSARKSLFVNVGERTNVTGSKSSPA
jgi:5-methyltetrahydrofolate--homocysteine methyltransferase